VNNFHQSHQDTEALVARAGVSGEWILLARACSEEAVHENATS
jgi:hypothetical protein